MEKYIYALWYDPVLARSMLNDVLRYNVAEVLAEDGSFDRIQLHLRDKAADAYHHIDVGADLPDAAISFWAISAARARQVERRMLAYATRVAGFQVDEKTPLPYIFPAGPAGRMDGFSQLAFFRRRPDLNLEQFKDIWINSHTDIAIETQQTFHYSQNIVLRPLTEDAPAWDGIVDEWYLEQAIKDPLIYWRGNGSVERQEYNFQREMTSIARFVDMDGLALMLTSAFRIGAWPAAIAKPV